MLKGVIKVVAALITAGASWELGQRGMKDLQNSLPKKPN